MCCLRGVYSRVCVLAVLLHSSVQFIPDRLYGTVAPMGSYHTTITQDALYTVAQNYFNDTRAIGAAAITSFDPDVMFAQYYEGKVSSQDFEDLVDAIETHVADVDKNDDTKDNPFWHFDAERFQEANQKLVTYFNYITLFIKFDDYDGARENLKILHTLQDFYSHSNWIEMNNTQPNTYLGVKNASIGTLSGPLDPTCTGCTRTTSEKALSGILNVITLGGTLVKAIHANVDRIYYCYGNLVEKTKLTSGYYSNQKDDSGKVVSKPTKTSKCSHGGVLDGTSELPPVGGINKDSNQNAFSPHEDLHDKAADVARAATVDFLNRVRANVGDDRFGKFMQLNPGPSLAFAIDTTETMKTYLPKIRAKISQLVDVAQTAAVQPSRYIIVPFDVFSAGPAQLYYTPQSLLQGFDRLATTPGTAEQIRQLTYGMLLAVRNSFIGGKVIAFSDSKEDPNLSVSQYNQLVTTAQRKRVQLDLITGSTALNANTTQQRRRRAVTTIDPEHSTLLQQGHMRAVYASGGQVYSGQDDELDRLMSVLDGNFQAKTVLLKRLLSNKVLTSGFSVDSTVDSVTILVTSVEGPKPNVSILSQNKTVDSSLLSVSTDTYNVYKCTLKVNGPGVYYLQFTDVVTNYAVDVTANASVRMSYRLHRDNDESQHPGTHEVEGRPLVNSTVWFEVSIRGSSSSLSPNVLVFVALNGDVLAKFSLEPVMGRDNRTYVANTIIPAVPFFVAMVGTNADGTPMQYYHPHLVEPSTVGITMTRVANTSLQVQADQQHLFTFNITNYGASGLFLVAADDSGDRLSALDTSGVLLPTGSSQIGHGTLTISAAGTNTTSGDVHVVVYGNSRLASNVGRYYYNVISSSAEGG